MAAMGRAGCRRGGRGGREERGGGEKIGAGDASEPESERASG